MMSLLLWAAIGAGVGATFGRLGKGIRSPLISTWQRGAASGAVAAVLLFFLTGQGRTEAMNQSSEAVTRLRPERFDAEVLQSSLPVMVDFYATWCGPCRALAPRVEEAAQKFSGRVRVFKVNIDEAPQLAQRYQIDAIPTLLFFSNGKLIDRRLGIVSPEDLAERLRTLAGSSNSARLVSPRQLAATESDPMIWTPF